MAGTVLLSAGGTGGHLFPAQALAQELAARGWRIHLATDPRAERFVSQFPAEQVHIIKSATFTGKSPLALGRTFARLAAGYLSARRVISAIRPDVAVGFGGYPTVPPLLAAAHKKVPTILHEQNAIMGRANRFLASRVKAIATGFELANKDSFSSAPVTVTGNPLREIAHKAARLAYDPPVAGGPFNLVVFGGSQGARFFSQCIPEALFRLSGDKKKRLNVTMQARPEDAEGVRAKMATLRIAATVEDFFADMPNRIAGAHLVICRSGASSVSELALIGRPGILVPLPGALDDDQGANAAVLEAVGGGVLVRQKDLTPERLAELLNAALEDPQSLANKAQCAKKAGVPDAAARLADMVEAYA